MQGAFFFLRYTNPAPLHKLRHMWSITLEKENISYCTSALIIIRRSTPIDQHRISNDFELSREHRHTLILILTDLQVINQMSTTGSYLTFVFSLNRQYSKDVVNKYFKRLRELLKDKLLAIKNRTSRTKKIINELKRLSILARVIILTRDLPRILFPM